MELARLDLFASAHHGVVTRQAAERAGVSRSAWYRALDAGWIAALHPNVARMHGSPTTVEQKIAAAVLAAGPGALASHGTAAFLWGLPGAEPSTVDLIVPRRERGPARPHLPAIHRSPRPTGSIALFSPLHQ